MGDCKNKDFSENKSDRNIVNIELPLTLVQD